MDQQEALERLNTLRNCIVQTQNATWSNVAYPLAAILDAAGLKFAKPTERQILAHQRGYDGAGGMPEPTDSKREQSE